MAQAGITYRPGTGPVPRGRRLKCLHRNAAPILVSSSAFGCEGAFVAATKTTSSDTAESGDPSGTEVTGAAPAKKTAAKKTAAKKTAAKKPATKKTTKKAAAKKDSE